MVLDNIVRAVRELGDNSVYHFDLTTRNILYSSQGLDIQIVDFEDRVRVCDSPDAGYMGVMIQELREMQRFINNHTISTLAPQME